MKKLLTTTIVFFMLILTLPQKTRAEGPVAEKIEKEDIEKLIVNLEKEPPFELLVPKPTPTPISKKESGDSRSWTKSEYRQIIKRVSEKYEVDPQLIYATIMTESSGDKYAFRYEPRIKDASLGLGQILISTARRLGFADNPKKLYQPDVSIELIGKYYRTILNEHGNLNTKQLVIAYNTGSPFKRAVRGHLYRFNKWYQGKES